MGVTGFCLRGTTVCKRKWRQLGPKGRIRVRFFLGRRASIQQLLLTLMLHRAVRLPPCSDPAVLKDAFFFHLTCPCTENARAI